MIKSLGEHFESYARLRPSEAPSCHARVLGLCLEAFVCTGYLGCQEGVLCIALQRLRLINILARSALPTRVFFPWRSIDFVSPTLLSMNCNSSISICPRNAEYGLACGKETCVHVSYSTHQFKRTARTLRSLHRRGSLLLVLCSDIFVTCRLADVGILQHIVSAPLFARW